MNEQEAREKWCPFARYAHPNAPTGGNRIIKKNTADARCIASNCMAWRQTADRSTEQACEENLHNMSGASDDGYCGLAGKP